MKRTFAARGLLLSLVLLIVFFSNAPESHGQESVSYSDYYARGNFENSWEALQDEVSARPVRQITYGRLDVRIKIAGDVYEQTGAISFADYHDLLKQMLNQDSKRALSLDLPTFVEYSEEIHSKKLSDEAQWNLEIDRVKLIGRGLYDRDRRARLFALDTFFSRKWYEEKTNVADDKINLRWLFFAGKSQFMISSINKQFLIDYVVHCEAQRGVHCDFTEEARYLSGVVPGCAEWNTGEFLRTATLEQVTACLAAGADVNSWNHGDGTPLHLAASSNENPAVIGLLLEAGADLEALEIAGETPLHFAAGNANAVAVEALLAAGANLEARGEEGRTPLHSAAMSYKDPAVVIGLLLEAGANLEAQVVWQAFSFGKGPGGTPLHEAVDYNQQNPAAVAALLAAGADVNARNRSGCTPLHLAASSNENPAVIGLLLEAGANLEARDEDDNTPLHRAVLWSHQNPAVIEALLDAGANAAARNAAGQTPWDLAQENEALKGSDAYWRLNDARRAPGGGSAGGPAGTTDPDPGVGGVCSRTRQVRDALVAASPVTTCSTVTDAHLATITELDPLNWASITSLKEGDFAGLSALTDLSLYDNDLSSLPAGVFSGLSALTYLSLQDNPVDPLPVAVSLVSAGTGAFKATAYTGAPFNMVVPVSVMNGTIEGGVTTTTVTIRAGRVDTVPLAVTRTPGTTGAVTADIGTLPGLPTDVDPEGIRRHLGYALVKSADLPLDLDLDIVATTPTGGVNGFTDDLLVPGVAVHFRELRTRIDALRTRAGL